MNNFLSKNILNYYPYHCYYFHFLFLPTIALHVLSLLSFLSFPFSFPILPFSVLFCSFYFLHLALLFFSLHFVLFPGTFWIQMNLFKVEYLMVSWIAYILNFQRFSLLTNISKNNLLTRCHYFFPVLSVLPCYYILKHALVIIYFVTRIISFIAHLLKPEI